MKTLVLLLACLAAANAAYYVAPCGYTSYSIQRFYIQVPASCFHFKVHYCGAWYTTKFYSGVMKVYPGEKCTEAGFKEMTEKEFTDDCAGKLRSKATTIFYEIRYHYYSWRSSLIAQLNAAKAKYRASLEKYTTTYCSYIYDPCQRKRYEQMRDEAIAKYCKVLSDRYTTATNAYATALNNRYYSVLAFHKKILDSSVKCFQTRKTKIAEFEKQITERIYSFLSKFKLTMAKIADQRAELYRKLLYKAHCNNYWMIRYVNEAVYSYRSCQYNTCYAQVSVYWSKLLAAKTRLVDFYRCAYQCATYSGCLSFTRKEYHSLCQSMGIWWSYKITSKTPYFRWVDYRFSWKACEYKNLVKCDLGAVNVSVEKFKEDMNAKAKSAMSAANGVFASWKMRWVGIHVMYYNKYVEIVNARHAFLVRALRAQYYCRYQCLSAYHLGCVSNYERELEKRRDEAVAAYRTQLNERIAKACQTYFARIASYKKMAEGLVAKVVGFYVTCMDTRTKKIAEYEAKQKKIRDEQRRCLSTRLVAIHNKKCNQYYEMMKFYHQCQTLTGATYTLWYNYKNKIWNEYCHWYHVFDAYWSKTLPQLVHHYSCGYKCRASAKFAIPSFKYCINWQVCYPTEQYYVYRYSYYCNYRSYTLHQDCGRYVWTA